MRKPKVKVELDEWGKWVHWAQPG